MAERPLEHGDGPANRALQHPRVVRWCLALALILVSGGGAGFDGVPQTSSFGVPVRVWLTTADLTSALSPQPSRRFVRDLGADTGAITVNDHITFQQMDGFGAAMTDTSAWLISYQLDRAARASLLQALFSPSNGIGIDWVRVPMGSSDYTHDHYYSYDDNGGMPDPSLANFSIQHDLAYIVPVLRQALRSNPAIKFNSNPWSPPAWMKSNQSMINGGRLLPQYYASLAQYFVRFLQAYQALGLTMYAIQPQNEPLAQTSYPSMYWPAVDEARFIANNLGPALAAAHLHPRILGYDHNWDQPGYAETLLSNAAAAPYLAGTAWHTYSGTSSAMSVVHGLFPSKDSYETESSVANPADLFINAARNWSRSGVMWNIALDTHGGPLPNNVGCVGCIGLATVDGAAGTYSLTRYYYQIGHFSKFVLPGAYRIDSSSFNGNLEDAAFRNPSGSMVLVAYNASSTIRNFKVVWGGESFHATLPAGAIATFAWNGS